MADLEKKLQRDSSSEEQVGKPVTKYEEVVTEEEETLHRGLKARQVSPLPTQMVHTTESW
jgi:hypothetical protein